MFARSNSILSPLVVLTATFAFAATATGQTTIPYGSVPTTVSPTNPFATTAPSLVPGSAAVPAPAYGSGIGTTPSLAAPWDPYAAPGAAAPPPALPPYGTPYAAPLAAPGLGFPFQDWSAPSTKLIQSLSIKSSWLPRFGDNGFGMTNVDLATSFAFPFFYNHNIAPIILTPGFNFHFLQGPGATPTRDLPGTVYDAFLQTSWQPQFTERFGADLAVSTGVYSDFNYVDGKSLRVLGRAVGLYTFSPQWKGALGVVYINRLDIKILPAGGLIWTPHEDARFEILFPQPKLAQRITNWGNTEVWGYIGGEYGGGQWSIAHSNGVRDVFTYNDLRIFLGVETIGVAGVRGFFEIGYVFNREIIYRSAAPQIEPTDTMMLRAGVSF